MTDAGLETKRPESFITTEGTEALDAQHKPSDIAYGMWVIPNGLNRSEWEDLAARILHMSNQEEQFVAPSLVAIAEQIVGEIKQEQAWEQWNNERSASEVTQNLVDRAKAGLAKLLGWKQEQPVVDVDAAPEPPRAPMSVLAFQLRFGNDALHGEIGGMIQEGLLEHVKKDEGDYFAPTQKLIDRLLAAQARREGTRA